MSKPTVFGPHSIASHTRVKLTPLMAKPASVDKMSDGSKHNKATYRGAAGVLKMSVGQLAITAVALVSGFLIPRVLLPEDFGKFSAAVAVVVFMQQISSLGVGYVGMRFLGVAWFGESRRNAHALASSLLSCMIYSTVLGALVCFVWLGVSTKLDISLGICLLISVFAFSRNGFYAMVSLFIPIGKVGTHAALTLGRVILHLTVVVLSYPLIGINGLFLTLAISSLFYLVYASSKMKSLLKLSWRPRAWFEIRPYWRYSFLTYLGGIGTTVQTSLSVYLIAVTTSVQQAAFLAVALQAGSALRGLSSSAIRVLIPILAEFNLIGNHARFQYWGGFLLRFNAFFISLVIIGWIILGRHFVRFVLTEQYIDVYPMITLVLFHLVIFMFGLCHNRLLNIKGYAGYALASDLVHLAATLAGYSWIYFSNTSLSTVFAILYVHIFAAICYAVSAVWIFHHVAKTPLNYFSATALLLPVFAIWLNFEQNLGLASSLFICTVACLSYFLYGLMFFKMDEFGVLYRSLREPTQ